MSTHGKKALHTLQLTYCGLIRNRASGPLAAGDEVGEGETKHADAKSKMQQEWSSMPPCQEVESRQTTPVLAGFVSPQNDVSETDERRTTMTW